MDSDFIRIEEQMDGRFKLTASALCTMTADADSISIVGGPVFATAALAEEAGIAWAGGIGVECLHIVTGTLAQPLMPEEIDLPL